MYDERGEKNVVGQLPFPEVIIYHLYTQKWRQIETNHGNISINSQAHEGKPSSSFGCKFLPITQSLNFSSISRNRYLSSNQ